MAATVARVFRVRGRVQGVGYRNFVQREAARLGLDGWVRNLDSGDVEVHAQGAQAELDDLAGALHRGPRFADVRGVEQIEAAVLKWQGFRIVS